MMLVAKLKRNKVSYMGISSVGRYFLDFASWLTFWWPSAIWPGVNSEDYRSDVELQVDLIDVRSQAVLWSKTYTHDETLSLSTPDRGWVPWGVLFVRFGVLTEGMLEDAGLMVRSPTWLEVEYQFLRDMWAPEGFKGVLDTEDFEDRVNNDQVQPRRVGLAVGVRQYGPRAAGVLERLGREAAQGQGLSESTLRAAYGDENLRFGMRAYAESDAQAMQEFLVSDAAGFSRAHQRVLKGEQATRVQIKAAIRQLAKARRGDSVFLYLNGETVVCDDPSQPGDELKKYFLPYDADLEGLEALLQEPASTERSLKIRRHLDATAISFDWLDDTFNQAGLDDHRYVMSRDVMMVLDVTFPGAVTGLRYAPDYAERFAGGWRPARGLVGEGEEGATAPEDGEQPMDEAPVDEQPADTAPGVPVAPEAPRRKVTPRRISGRAVESTTLFADAEQPPRAEKPVINRTFLEDLARPRGRYVVVTARFNELNLDVIPQKRGGFVHHFLRGARSRDRVPYDRVGQRLVVQAGSLIDYTRARIEDESRTLNQSQSVLTLGEHDEFEVVRGGE